MNKAEPIETTLGSAFNMYPIYLFNILWRVFFVLITQTRYDKIIIASELKTGICGGDYTVSAICQTWKR